MPNTAKQEAIRKAYGEYWETYRVDEDGYSSMDNSNFYPNVDWHPNKNHLWRPKSLQGIENNNGWTMIEEGIPSEHGVYYVMFRGWETNDRLIGKEAYYGKDKGWDSFLEVTHYKPIVKPEKPIY